MGISKHFGTGNYAWNVGIIQNICRFCRFLLRDFLWLLLIFFGDDEVKTFGTKCSINPTTSAETLTPLHIA